MRLFLLAGVLLLAAAAGCKAASWYFEEYSIMIEPENMPLPGKTYGYEDINLKVHNRSNMPHTVRIKLLSRDRMSQLQSISKTVTLEPGSVVPVRLSKPYLEMHEVEMKLWIDRIPQKPFNLKPYNQQNNFSWAKPASLLLSKQLSYDFFDDLINSGMKDSGLEAQINVYRSEKLMETPNTYSGFDCVLFNAGLLSKASPEALKTLYDYVRRGGSLFIAGKYEPQVTALKSKGGQMEYYEYGLGLIALADVDNSGLKELDWDGLSRQLWWNRPYVFDHMNRERNINDWFAVVNVAPVPVKMMVSVIAALVIIIGPINILVLRLINRPVLMYVTIPVISLMGVAAILWFSVRNEGAENTVRSHSFTILDQRTGTASTEGVLGYYCPLLPIGELDFEYSSHVLPLYLSPYGGNGDKHINLDESQKFYGSWINSRVPSHFGILKLSENNPAAVTLIETKDGMPEVFNNTTLVIRKIRYKDSKGNIWETADLDAGRKTILKPSRINPSSMQLLPVRKTFTLDWLSAGNYIYRNPYQTLYPGCYIAEFDGELFLEEPAGDKIALEKRDSCIYGITGGLK